MPTPVRQRRGLSVRARRQWKRTYERTSYDRLPWFDPGPSPSTRDALASRFFRPRDSVLDIGCGAGSNVIFLAKSGVRAFGVDVSPGAIAAAASRAARAGVAVDVREGDALALGFPDGRFDGVMDHGCFHTLPIPRRTDYATEVRRVLRSDGHFVLSWVAREHTAEFGPPHRPSIEEVARTFEPQFLITRTAFQPPSEASGPASYTAFLVRRSSPQPPRR